MVILLTETLRRRAQAGVVESSREGSEGLVSATSISRVRPGRPKAALPVCL